MEKDRTKYNFNGKTNLGKNKLAKEIIEKYLVDNLNKSYKEIKNIFNFKASNSYVIIYDDYDYTQWRNRQKNEIKRYYSPHDSIKYYITNQWDKDTIKPLISKAINDFGYSIEDSKSLEKNSIINVASSNGTVGLVKKIGNLDFKIDYEKEFSNWNLKTPSQAGKITPKTRNISILEKLRTTIPKALDESIDNLFKISNLEELNKIHKRFKKDGDLNHLNVGNNNANCSNSLHRYIKFLEAIENKEHEFNKVIDVDTYINFLKLLSFKEDLKPRDIHNNIFFNIGQPNTGKSYKFEESKIFDVVDSQYYRYLKIPVSGGIGNEYKGLQNTDLAITYDPIKEELRFGEFLQMLMSAIVNPKVPYVVFLDDFHNQDISSLLSEYTPLFKGQQKRDLEDIATNNAIYNPTFNDVNEFIKQWNEFIESHCIDIPIVPLTNRISGASLKLVYPSNFYLLGAANFNENSLNIFADWEDRAVINYIDPIESFTKEDEANEFLKCCKKLNKELRELLENKKIFDYEKYCFGMWKIVDSAGSIITNENEKKKLIKFFFSMIKNSLKHNNKNSEINNIGWELIVKMQEDTWFKDNIQSLANITDIDYKILHKHNIYEDEI